MFILYTDNDPDGYVNYQEYLKANENSFPTNAFKLATSEWYYNFSDHRCPHDAWLEHFTLKTENKLHDQKSIDIHLCLLGAYHDMFLEFHYKNVREYNLTGQNFPSNQEDWIIDEFRMNKNGLLIHEIEWAQKSDITSKWKIVCDDVSFSTKPLE